MLLILLLFSTLALAQENKVVVLDTGLDLKDQRFSSLLCKDGHMDFTGMGLYDNHGHGTHVAGIIKQYAKDKNYCLVIVKYYDTQELQNTTDIFHQALLYASILGAKVVNVSGGGAGYSEIEYDAIFNTLETRYIVAAGNDKTNIDKTPYYPASYRTKNIIIVGALDKTGKKRLKSSNWGKGIVWEVGENIISYLPDNAIGSMSGTSMATAVHTGKYIYEAAW